MRMTGNRITCAAGETVRIKVDPILGTDGITPYTGMTVAKLAAKQGVASPIISDMTITGSKVVGSFTQAQTLTMLGEYEWEVRVKGSGGDVDIVASGTLDVRAGAIIVAI